MFLELYICNPNKMFPLAAYTLTGSWHVNIFFSPLTVTVFLLLMLSHRSLSVYLFTGMPDNIGRWPADDK